MKIFSLVLTLLFCTSSSLIYAQVDSNQKPQPKPKPVEIPDAAFDTDNTSYEEIFQVVEQMPRFPGCDNSLDKREYEKCSREKMLQFIYGNLVYPTKAKEEGLEGTIVMRYIVETDGEITNAEVVRDIGSGCGEAGLAVVNAMPKWLPGRQRGRAVRVYFNLPIKFRL